MQTAPVSRACGCAAFLTTAAVDEAKGPAAMARGNSSCTSLSVEYVGKRRDESRPGTACRAPTFLNPTLSTASKPNEVMAGLSCASTGRW